MQKNEKEKQNKMRLLRIRKLKKWELGYLRRKNLKPGSDLGAEVIPRDGQSS